MPVAEHTLTDLLRDSGRVLREIEEGEVLLHRRDGPDLVVMTHGHRQAEATALRAFAAFCAGGMDRAIAVMPWLAFLDEEGRSECLRELSEAAQVAVVTGHGRRLAELLYEWEASALAAWDERRLRERSDYQAYLYEEPVPVERPER